MTNLWLFLSILLHSLKQYLPYQTVDFKQMWRSTVRWMTEFIWNACIMNGMEWICIIQQSGRRDTDLNIYFINVWRIYIYTPYNSIVGLHGDIIGYSLFARLWDMFALLLMMAEECMYEREWMYVYVCVLCVCKSSMGQQRY